MALVLALVAPVLLNVGTREAAAASPPTWRPFYFAVDVSTATAYDPSRWTPARTGTPAHPGRTIGLEVYAPVGLSGPLPTVIFAPGYRVGPAFDQLLLRSMASAGYLVIGLDFPGSTWANSTGGPISRDLVNNARDMSFVLTWLAQQPQWAARVDFSAVAAAGHSDGAIEVAALALNTAYADHRFAAFMELSGGIDASFGGSWGPINTAPLLTSIGTNDEFGARPTTLSTWGMAAGPKTLLDVAGGDHWQMYTLWSPQGSALREAIVEWMNLTLRHDPNALGPFWSNASKLGVSANTATANSIDATYNLLGAGRSPLGGRTSGVGRDPRNGGTVGYFQHGAIYDTVGLGVRVVWGEVWNQYGRLGGVTGFLGYPVTNELVLPGGVGRAQIFQGGSIYWSPATGAHEVHGGIRDAWGRTGWERGPLGYPLTDERGTPDGIGRYNHFQGGSVYWSPATGAHPVTGAVRSLWASMGWENSWLGYPSADAIVKGSVVQAPFQRGTIYASWRGAFALSTAAADRYVLAGGPTGPLGLPTSSTATSGSVQTSSFTGGSIVANFGTNTVTVTTAAGTIAGPIDSLRPWADRTYHAILNRPVDTGGAGFVTDQIRKGADLMGVAIGIARSTEARSRAVELLYHQVLHRGSDPGGRAWAMNFLAAGGKPAQLVIVLSGSPEFWSDAGRTPTGFVQLAYQRLLGRPADGPGLSYWSGEVARGLPLTTVAGALAGSEEASRLAVTNVYVSVLGHGPDPGGLAYWAAWWRGTGGDTVGLIARFTASVEFSNR